MVNDECLVCGSLLEYLQEDEIMECALCHKKMASRTRCVKGHFVCDECHTSGMDSVMAVCLRSSSKDPINIINLLMSQPFCHFHGPEHHVLVGSALLTAYRNAGVDIQLEEALVEMQKRGKAVPGGACGFWGSCGAGISAGMFVSILTKATPLTQETWGLSNLMTSKALDAIGKVGGPRCCKRNSYLAILTAIDFVKEHFGVQMEKPAVKCARSHDNNQCIGKRCPFHCQ